MASPNPASSPRQSPGESGALPSSSTSASTSFRQQQPRLPAINTLTTTASNEQAARRPSTASESSEDGYRMSPAAARRFARRNMRRTSPTPDLVTSLVRPPSPDTFYSRARPETRRRPTGPAAAALGVRNVGTSPDARSGPLMKPHPSSLDLPLRWGGHLVFDMYSLDYVNETDTNLLCPICHDTLVDPVTTPCDHTFCYRCLRRSIELSPSGSACPIDRELMSWSDCFSAARLVRTQLNALMVRCPHSVRGCKQELRREEVEYHAEHTCSYGKYSCPDSSCNKKLRRKPDIMTNDCPHGVIVQCEECQGEIDEVDRPDHVLECPKAKTRCEACWKMVCRDRLTEHGDTECEGVIVGCPYQDVGCPVRNSRNLINIHATTCSFHPETASGIVIRSQRDLIQTFENFSGELQHMRQQQDESNRQIEELSARLGQRGGSADSLVGDNRTMQDLDAGFEEIHQNLTHLEARQSMWTLNQVMPIREEVTELRNNINMIRMHVNWLLNRSREEGRMRAANGAAAGAGGLRRDEGSDVTRVLPERRRSAGAETDLPRL